jgi:hypothetical protein
MKNQRGNAELLLVIIACIFLFGGVFVLGGILSYYHCHRQWDAAGMSEVSWGVLQGCMLKMPDGRWIPAERVREIDLPRANLTAPPSVVK